VAGTDHPSAALPGVLQPIRAVPQHVGDGIRQLARIEKRPQIPARAIQAVAAGPRVGRQPIQPEALQPPGGLRRAAALCPGPPRPPPGPTPPPAASHLTTPASKAASPPRPDKRSAARRGGSAGVGRGRPWSASRKPPSPPLVPSGLAPSDFFLPAMISDPGR